MKFELVFFDDILICSATMDDQCNHMRHVYEELLENKLYAKLSKCNVSQALVDIWAISLVLKE